MLANIETLKTQGWKKTASVDACGRGHWVDVLSHPDHQGLFAVAQCCDHRRAWLWSADSEEALDCSI